MRKLVVVEDRSNPVAALAYVGLGHQRITEAAGGHDLASAMQELPAGGHGGPLDDLPGSHEIGVFRRHQTEDFRLRLADETAGVDRGVGCGGQGERAVARREPEPVDEDRDIEEPRWPELEGGKDRRFRLTLAGELVERPRRPPLQERQEQQRRDGDRPAQIAEERKNPLAEGDCEMEQDQGPDQGRPHRNRNKTAERGSQHSRADVGGQTHAGHETGYEHRQHQVALEPRGRSSDATRRQGAASHRPGSEEAPGAVKTHIADGDTGRNPDQGGGERHLPFGHQQTAADGGGVLEDKGGEAREESLKRRAIG